MAVETPFTVLPPEFKDKTVWDEDRKNWPRIILDRLPMHQEWVDQLISKASGQEKKVLTCFRDLLDPATQLYAKQAALWGNVKLEDRFIPWDKAAPTKRDDKGRIVEIGACDALITTCDKWIATFKNEPESKLYVAWLKQLKAAATAKTSSALANAVEKSQEVSWQMHKLGLLVPVLSISDYVTLPDAPETSLLKVGEIELYIGRPVKMPELKEIRERVRARRSIKRLPPVKEFILDCLAVAGNGVFSFSSGQMFSKRGGVLMNANASECIEPMGRMFARLGINRNSFSVATDILFAHELFHLVGPRENKKSNPYLTEHKSDAPTVELSLELALEKHDLHTVVHGLGMIYSLMASLKKFEAANDDSYRLSGLMVMGILCKTGVLSWNRKNHEPVVTDNEQAVKLAIAQFKRLRLNYFVYKSERLPKLQTTADMDKIVQWYLQFK